MRYFVGFRQEPEMTRYVHARPSLMNNRIWSQDGTRAEEHMRSHDKLDMLEGHEPVFVKCVQRATRDLDKRCLEMLLPD